MPRAPSSERRGFVATFMVARGAGIRLFLRGALFQVGFAVWAGVVLALLAGPALSLPNMIVLWKLMGGKVHDRLKVHHDRAQAALGGRGVRTRRPGARQLRAHPHAGDPHEDDHSAGDGRCRRHAGLRSLYRRPP